MHDHGGGVGMLASLSRHGMAVRARRHWSQVTKRGCALSETDDGIRDGRCHDVFQTRQAAFRPAAVCGRRFDSQHLSAEKEATMSLSTTVAGPAASSLIGAWAK